MAISSSSGSNSIDYSSSPSSSNLSASSLDSIPESREPTPEYDPAVAYEVLAPLHWDAEEFDFGIASEDDEPQTEGEDLQLLFQEELESSSEEGFSWDGADSSSEEEIGSSSSGDDSMEGKSFRFLGSSEEDSEEESGGGGGWSDAAETDGGSSAFDGASDDDDDSDGRDTPARSPKRRRY